MLKTLSKTKSFYWEGIKQNGDRVRGILQAENINTIKAALQKESITLLKVRRQLLVWRQKPPIKSRHILDFFRQLMTLLDAGLPLVAALQILGQSQSSKDASLTELIIVLKNEIEQGHTFAEGLRRYPQYFDALSCNLIDVGEQSGALPILLKQLIIYQEKTALLLQKMKKALIYPATVVAIALLVTLMLLVFVVPQFKSLFQGFGAELPAYTQFVLQLAEITKKFGGLLLLLIALAVMGVRWYKKHSPTGAYFVDKETLRLPILSQFLTKIIIARFARTLAITFNAGLPIAQALQLIANSCGNLVYTHAIVKIREQILTGQPIHSAMQDTQLFPQRVIQMIAIAEETGTLTVMLNKIADFYDQEIDNIVENISKLLEPAIMAILGLLIGGLIAAMYLPIFRLGSVI